MHLLMQPVPVVTRFQKMGTVNLINKVEFISIPSTNQVWPQSMKKLSVHQILKNTRKEETRGNFHGCQTFETKIATFS